MHDHGAKWAGVVPRAPGPSATNAQHSCVIPAGNAIYIGGPFEIAGNLTPPFLTDAQLVAQALVGWRTPPLLSMSLSVDGMRSRTPIQTVATGAFALLPPSSDPFNSEHSRLAGRAAVIGDLVILPPLRARDHEIVVTAYGLSKNPIVTRIAITQQ